MMEKTQTLFVVALAAVTTTPVSGWAENAQQLLARAKEVSEQRAPKDVTENARVTITARDGNEQAQEMKIYEKNYGPKTSKALTVILDPPQFRNTTVLSWTYPDKEADYWVYSPITGQVRASEVRFDKPAMLGILPPRKGEFLDDLFAVEAAQQIARDVS
jgi:hypothetical protein